MENGNIVLVIRQYYDHLLHIYICIIHIIFVFFFRYDFTPTEEEKESVKNLISDLTISNDMFVRTAPVYNPGRHKYPPREPFLNPQTTFLCEKLGIDDPIQVVMARSGRTMKLNVCMEESDEPQVESTPMKCSKLSLPAPVTPSENESQDFSQENTTFTPDTSFVSDANTTSECITPPSATKKIFKRRNLAMYTPDQDEHSVSDNCDILIDVSPRTSKVHRSNEQD